MTEALFAFFLLLDHDPDRPLGHYLCGLGLQALGLDWEARAEWRTVLTLTAGKDDASSGEDAWVRGMARHLLLQKVND